MNQKRFHCVADGRSLNFGVHANFQRHVKIGGLVNESVTNARARFDDGNRAVFDDAGNQACTAARNNHVNQLAQAAHDDNRVAVKNADKFNELFGHALSNRRVTHNFDDCFIRADNFRTAAQQTRVAGLETQSNRVRRDVRSGLKNNADDAERYACATNFQTVGARDVEVNFFERVGQFDDLADTFGHVANTLRRQNHAVNHVLAHGRFFAGGLNFAFVDFQNFVLPRFECISHCRQCRVAFVARQCCQYPRRFFGAAGLFCDVIFHEH